MKEAYVKTCRRTVATAGVPEHFETGAPAFWVVKSVTMRAYAGNTGNIYLGDSNRVSSTDYSYVLAPGETLSLDATPLGEEFYIFLTQLWLDVDNDGDGLCFVAICDMEPW